MQKGLQFGKYRGEIQQYNNEKQKYLKYIQSKQG